MSGRGAYYKAKYGGKGGGSRGGGSRGGGSRGGGSRGEKWHDYGGRNSGDRTRNTAWETHSQPSFNGISTIDNLESLLNQIDGQQYGAYKRLTGAYLINNFELGIVHVQSDAYAAPSRIYVRVSIERANIPEEMISNKIRCVALADYLTRKFINVIGETKADIRTSGNSWSSGKGGELIMEKPSQAVLERTSIQILPSKGIIEARLGVAFPASGRTIKARWCSEILTKTVPKLVESSLFWNVLNTDEAINHVLCIEDQEYLRNNLDNLGLCAFVGNGSILPRASGANDEPMIGGDVVRFISPESLRTTIQLPNKGSLIGMGIRKGVICICGGGYNGKSTLLHALQLGVYNHVPGDGREYVSCNYSAVKIRAEDGRPIHSLNISSFINNLPFNKSTTQFSSVDASGSTSQAANIMEALEIGSTCLLLDEDTCATNFMFRDERMKELVHPTKEPITPFLDRVKQLWTDHHVSTVMVIGSCGAYFDVASTILMLDCYKCLDVTEKAKSIKPASVINPAESLSRPRSRQMDTASLLPAGDRGKVTVKDASKINYGPNDEHAIDVSKLEQLIETPQLHFIASYMQVLSQNMDNKAFNELLQNLECRIDDIGLDAVELAGRPCNGSLARARPFEVAAAINRWRNLKMT